MARDRDIKRKEQAAAVQLATETLRHAATADWWAEREFMLKSRGSELTLNEVHQKMGTITGHAFNLAVQQLIDLAMHHPEGKERRRSSEVLVKLHLAEVELKLKYLQNYAIVDGSVVQEKKDEPSVSVKALPELPPMTDEQLRQLVQARSRRTA